jgi:hypothetical protein
MTILIPSTRSLLVSSTSHEIHRNVWQPEFHPRIYKSSPLVPTLRHVSSTRHPTSLRSILILFSHLGLVLPIGIYSLDFLTTILYAFFLIPMPATCHTHLLFLDLTTKTTFGKKHKSWSSSLCSVPRFYYFLPRRSHTVGRNVSSRLVCAAALRPSSF